MAQKERRSRKELGPASPKDRQFVLALARGLQLLRCFSPTISELSTSELARMTGLPQPTVWRLCHTMMKLGFLNPGERGNAVRLGVPVLGLGFAVLSSFPITRLARPYMQKIADKYEGAVSLGARDGKGMIFLQRCQGPSIVLDFAVGSRVPMMYSATGWAYIAGTPAGQRDELLRSVRPASASKWKAIAKQLDLALQSYERAGYIITKGVAHPLINAVAAPLRSLTGNQLLTLSAGGVHSLFDDARLEKAGAELLALARTLAPLLDAGDRELAPRGA